MQGAYGHLYAQVSQRAIAPLGEARNNVRLFGELGRRMGFPEACFDDREDELIDQALATKQSVVRRNHSRAAGARRPCPPRAAGQ